MRLVKLPSSHQQSLVQNMPSSDECSSLSSSDSSFPVDALPKLVTTVDNNSIHSITHRRRVHFCEDQNINHIALCPCDDTQDRWYSKADLHTFKVEAAKQARTIIVKTVQTPDYQQWSESLVRAYRGFLTASTVLEMAEIISSCQTFLSPDVVGLERWILRDIQQDRSLRPKLVWKNIQRLQRRQGAVGRSENCDDCAEEIRKASRRITGISRLYAHYLATLSASTERGIDILE